jgi:hypothetical protein
LLLTPQWLFGLRQHGSKLLLRLILRLRRKIKRIETVFPPCRKPKKALVVATA